MKKKNRAPAKKRRPARRVKSAAASNLKIIFTEKQIQKRIRELAAQMNRDYEGKTLHVVGVLENCFVFMADLVRRLKMPVICHFIKAETRDASAGSVAVREILYTPKIEATGRDVLLVDAILQSGVTLDHLVRYVLGQNPISVRTATLIEKTDERKVDVLTDYVGFQSTAKFLVGYGLGFKEQYRNLPFVASLLSTN